MKLRGVLFILLLAIVMLFASCSEEPKQNNKPTPSPESEDTIKFDGTKVTWGTTSITLDDHNIYLDGRLSDEVVAANQYAFKDFRSAVAALVSGTVENPMNLWIAPYVYWVHDPDSASTTDAYQVTINNIANLHMTGMTKDPKNVVIAMNYGHNEGYDGGNPTMLRVTGSCDGLTLKNITFGGYCNIDLVYPLDETLNRDKRTTNVTQCQLASYGGDKLFAENCRFVSRLNMMPFNNSKRALYVNCHFESTDDSLNGSSQAVYLGCDFEFYGTKPWGGSSGVTLLNCTLNSVLYNVATNPYQYLSKMGGQFVLIDCNYVDSYTIPVTFGFSDVNSPTFRAYVSNVTRNGQPLAMTELHSDRPAADITDTELLKNWKLVDSSGNVIYNTYNLLKGSDDWDPMGVKDAVTAITTEYVTRSFSASVSPSSLTVGEDAIAKITTKNGSGNASYSISEDSSQYVTLTKQDDGSCNVTAKDVEIYENVSVIVDVRTTDGHAAAVALTVKPGQREAPIIYDVSVAQTTDGKAKLTYDIEIDSNLTDVSKVTWYIADDADGTNKMEVAVGRTNEPLKEIALNPAYVGKFVSAMIVPQSNLSPAGSTIEVVTESAITAEGIPTKSAISTDFSSISLANHDLKAGFWTIDGYTPKDVLAGYKPLDSTVESTKYSAKVGGKFGTPSNNSWAYGTGAKNGFLNYSGIYHISRGGRVYFTPVGTTFGDMSVTVKMAPGKTAAQGFGSDYQYMDIMLKFDFATVTGFGLRIYRKSGASCEFVLMEYKDGLSKEICTPVEAGVFITECTAKVWTEGTTLKAEITTSAAVAEPTKVSLSSTITANNLGAFGVINTGTTGDNTTYLGGAEVEWN